MFKLLVWFGGLTLCACSAASGDGTKVDGSGSNSSGANASSTSGQTGNSGGSLQLDPDAVAGTGGSGGADKGCASESQEAHAVPTDLLILLDQSGSMTLEGNRWDPTSNALKAFAQSPSAGGLGIGLQYFPLGATKTEDPAICLPQNYVAPAVPIAALPDNAPPLVTSIDMHHFTAAEGNDAAHWGTPTRPAIEGALQYLATYQAANPERHLYLLLATDGLPSKLCTGNDVDGIAGVLAAAAALPRPIQTFVIGIGEIARLNTLAQAGGTGQPAFIVDAAGTNTEAQLGAALEAIRHTALPCEFDIPKPMTGRIDPGQVNVELNLDSGKTVFPKVESASACATGSSWYYDSETAPSKVIMCPAACETLKGGNGRIDIVFGCKTVTK
jgi:hypothetical protein